MSYILDALKKSQAEQAGEGARVQLEYPKRGMRLSHWLGMGLGLLLLVNVSVMVWFFAFRTESDTAEPAPVAVNPPQRRPLNNSQNTTQPAPAKPPPATSPPTSRATSPPTSSSPSPAATAAAVPAPDAAQPLPSRVAMPAPVTRPAPSTPPAAAKLPRLQLDELPDVEQTLYRDFRFSSHMYSPDDPQAGAIFIDGQMLKVGAAFKGLTIAEINEFSVVFKEVRRGKAREVEIQLADHWN